MLIELDPSNAGAIGNRGVARREEADLDGAGNTIQPAMG
jgi:hypothetical protein